MSAPYIPAGWEVKRETARECTNIECMRIGRLAEFRLTFTTMDGRVDQILYRCKEHIPGRLWEACGLPPYGGAR